MCARAARDIMYGKKTEAERMKTVGLIGGMSWESTLYYYENLNGYAARELGGLHSAKCLVYSVDFAEIEPLQAAGKWDECGRIMAAAARSLERAGADFLALCTNTMHIAAPAIERAAKIPLLHIADAAADELSRLGVRHAALLGTRYTLRNGFLAERLAARGVETLLPPEPDIDALDAAIFSELCLGVVRDETRGLYLDAARALIGRGAEAVLLGCTELGMLVKPGDLPAPVIDSAGAHVKAIWNAMASG